MKPFRGLFEDFVNGRRFLVAVGQRVIRGLGFILRWQPLTFRGFLVVVLCIWALDKFAITESDLAVAVLAGSLLFALVLCLFFAFVIRIRLGNRLSVEGSFDRNNPVSRSGVDSGLILHQSSLPPFFSLRAIRLFQNGDNVISPQHLVKGRTAINQSRILTDQVIFPHRGIWTLPLIKVSLEDALGFTSLSWKIPLEAAAEVSAPPVWINPPQIAAASSQPGDDFNFSTQRSGELYDIRPYEPGDGSRRILWKTYAKRGELVVRRPEPAIIPEGQLAVYLIAKRKDDHVAAACQSYLMLLNEQQIKVFFGTDGIDFSEDDDSASSTTKTNNESKGSHPGSNCHFCTSISDMRRAINHSVWSNEVGTGRGFEKYLQSLISNGHLLSQAVIFAPFTYHQTGNLLHLYPFRHKQKPLFDWSSNVVNTAASYSIRLTLALVPEDLLDGGINHAPKEDTRYFAQPGLEGADLLLIEPLSRGF